VNIAQAALGAEVEVPTLNGRATMKVPAGTQSGQLFRLRGKGMPDVRGGSAGDLHVRLIVETPTKLSAEQRRLLQEFARASGEGTYPQAGSFMDKVRRVMGKR
jgi:molecular chaperone DnaJ